MSTRFLKFLAVGGLNTLFGFAVYSLLALTIMPTWLVLIASNLAGIAFNFVTTGGLVFRSLEWRRAPRFVICYGVIYCLYLGAIHVLAPLTGGRIQAMAVIVIPMAVLTYWLLATFVFQPHEIKKGIKKGTEEN